MNNTRMRNDTGAALPVSTSLNIQKENLSFNAAKSCKNVAENAFKNFKALDERESCQETINVKHTVQVNDDSFHTVMPDVLKKKKKKRTLSNSFNKSKKVVKSKKKMLNEKGNVKVPKEGFDHSTKFYISCLFCRKGFETLEYFNAHKCKKKGKKSNFKLYKCKSCSLTFSQKRYLNKHVKDHKRNNCTICNAQFTKRKALCKHLRIEHEIKEPEKFHECSFCSKHFFKRRSLYLHLKSHVDDQFFCLECGFSCNEEYEYNNHVQEHIKNLKHECHLCGRKFARRQQYDQHMTGHEKYACSSCNITFSTKKLLLKHQQSVHHIQVEKRKFSCSICDKLFFRPIQLKIHQRIHTGEELVKCSHCDKSFSNDKSLSKHMKTVTHLQHVSNDEGKVIKIEKLYLCSECGARFYQRQSLLRHIQVIHSDRESSKCPYCDYNTKVKTNLKRHIELHTSTKHFNCKICDSSFRTFATLKEHHAFVHSENREFICDICNKGFKNKSSLQRHMRIHSENRPYKCYCDRSYKRMSHLKRHLVAAHHITVKKNQLTIVKESVNLDTCLIDKDALVESLKVLSNDSSCDDFVSTTSNDLNNSNINRTEQSAATIERGCNYTNVPSTTTVQILLEKSDNPVTSNNSKDTFITCAKTTICALADPQSFSISLDDPNLNLSCNFNLPSSPLTSIPMEIMTPALQHSIHSQNDDVPFSSSTDSLIRPHSLPNLTFQTDVSSIDSFANFSLHNSDSPTSLQFPSFLLTDDISSPSRDTDLNLDQNSSPKQLFGDTDNILSLPPYTPNSALSESNCSSEHFFSPVRNIELWNNDLVPASTCTNTNFSTSMTDNVNNLFPHNLFPGDSLMACSLDATALNSEFDALSSLC